MKQRIIQVNSCSGWSLVSEIDVTILSPLAREAAIELTKRDLDGDYRVVAVTVENSIITQGWK